MTAILKLPSAWRGDFLPAQFRNAKFYVDTKSRDNGRRIVTHEFPKKELPYSEDMGRRAIEFTVRGYCVQYPAPLTGTDAIAARLNSDGLHDADYRLSRNALVNALEQDGDGTLQLPFFDPMRVVVTRYRLTEEDKFGGFCTFDMTFVEFGAPPPQLTTSRADLTGAATNLSNSVQQQMGPTGPQATTQ